MSFQKRLMNIYRTDVNEKEFPDISYVIRARDLPEHYVSCFFKEVIEACEFYFD